MNASLKSFFVLLLLMVAVAVAVPALADGDLDRNDKPVISITPYLGAGFWADDTALDNSNLFGARAAFHLTRSLALEGTYGRSAADQLVTGTGVDLDHYGLDLVWNLRRGGGLVPYLTAGWAQIDHKLDGAAHTEVLNGAEVGVGLRARLGGDNANYRALRFDVRNVMSNLTPSFANDNKTTHNIIASVGLQFAFGKSSRDSDLDGVRDRDDACAGTPAGALIDAVGCPTDADGDGVFDGLDKCPATPAMALVDASGCPLDSDGDGVFDGLDKCADTPAKLQVDQSGCPIAVTETEIQLLDTGRITTGAIVFATNSAQIDLANSAILAEIGETLTRWPELQMEIIGHTDSQGSAAYNQKLSQQRAQSVLDYFKATYPGINTAQYKATGRGEEAPIADNTTVEGRQANRRVVFEVLNADALKREIEHRKLLER